jgi:hypothetical protein
MNPSERAVLNTFVCLVLPVLVLGFKRARERSKELVAAVNFRRAIDRMPNVKRHREGLEQELRELDNATFTRMFRMPKHVFFQLHEQCASKIKTESPKANHMAWVSSGSPVSTVVLFAATIRWLAGGSLWDIAFMFKMSYKTIHAYKYKVIHAINHTLRGNILFPTSDVGLESLAKGFAGIANGMGGAIPGVVAAVDSVCIQRKAPSARKSQDGTFISAIGQAFNRYFHSMLHVQNFDRIY